MQWLANICVRRPIFASVLILKLVVVGTGGNVNLLGDTDCPLLLVRGTSQRQVARATSAE